MKKLFSLAIAIALVALLTTPVLADSLHHGGKRVASYSVCSTQSCTLTGVHTHNGRNYSGHYYGDGHDYHGYCDVADCTLSGYHDHDGEYCFGHKTYDGHSYHRKSRGHH